MNLDIRKCLTVRGGLSTERPNISHQTPLQPLPLPKPSTTTGASKQRGTPDLLATEMVTCRSCGVQFDPHPEEDLVNCPLCGGKNMGGSPKTTETYILDLNEPILNIGYIKPYLSLKDARWQVIAAIKGSACGIKNADTLNMDIKGIFFPLWKIRATGDCVWIGERDVELEYKEWKKSRGDKKSSCCKTSEAEQKKSFIPTSISGQAHFDYEVELPAALKLSDEKIKIIRDGCQPKITFGPPPLQENFVVVFPSISQGKAWSPEIVEKAALIATQHLACKINNVSPQLQSRSFSICYVPFAVVRYDVDGSEYCHFVNLQTGSIFGPPPLDLSAVSKQATIAWHQEKHFLAQKKAQKVCFLGTNKNETPWESFLHNYFPFLARLWINAPEEIRKELEKLYSSEEIKRIRETFADAVNLGTLNNPDFIASFSYFVGQAGYALVMASDPVITPISALNNTAMAFASFRRHYLTLKRCIWAGCVIVMVWGGCHIGIQMKQRLDFRNAVQAEKYDDADRLGAVLAPKWEPATLYLEYRSARQAFESALQDTDIVAFRKGGGDAWTEIASQQQLGEKCIRYPSRHKEGRDAYAAALSKLNNVKTMIRRDGETYVGEYKNGKRDGKGTFFLVNGQKYVGGFKNDKKNGQGTLTWAEGRMYVGEWQDDMPNGQGTETLPDGEKYVGEYKSGKRDGQGMLISANGQKYVGGFKNDKKNGQGTLTWAEGRMYVGEWRDDQWNGRGTETIPNKEKYMGDYKNGERNGQGTLISADGQKYVGEFKANKKNGQGTLVCQKGEKYIGKWENDQLNGHGTHIFSNGNVFIGEYKDGMAEGQGKLLDSTGRIIYEGIFNKNQYVTSSASNYYDWQQQLDIIMKKIGNQAESEVSIQDAASSLGITYPLQKTKISFYLIQQEVYNLLNAQIKPFDKNRIRTAIENEHPLWKVGDKVDVICRNRTYSGKIWRMDESGIRIGDFLLNTIDFVDDVYMHLDCDKRREFIARLVCEQEAKFIFERKIIENNLWEQASKKYGLTRFKGQWYTDEGIMNILAKLRKEMVQNLVNKYQTFEPYRTQIAHAKRLQAPCATNTSANAP